MSKTGEKSSKQDHVQQEQGVHGEAAGDQHGHSGEGAASAMAHMISQDSQKTRRHHATEADEDSSAN